MIREISMEEISDGKLYKRNDMVKADCHDCRGCSKCCHGMGNSIVLDPYDIYQMQKGLSMSFEQLLQAGYIELNIVDRLTLPNIKMQGKEDVCGFLDEAGRCKIHPYRPGICRLFPLGRYYEKEDFWYFLQVYECPNEARSKIKVKKWIDTPRLQEYERFVKEWHFFLKKMEAYSASITDEEEIKNTSLYILMSFYIKSYDIETDFYAQFFKRLAEAEKLL